MFFHNVDSDIFILYHGTTISEYTGSTQEVLIYHATKDY